MLKKILAVLVMLYAALAMAAVDVNKATDAELDGVKGIGPVITKLITTERKKGEFKSWQDFIDRVKGVGEKSAVKLSENGLTVNGQAYKAAATAAKDTKAAVKEEKKETKVDAKSDKAVAKVDAKADKSVAKVDAKSDKAVAKADAKAEKAEAKADKKEAKAEAKADKKEARAEARADKKEAKADAAKPAASAAKK